MNLTLDREKTYALALEGGGAKGAYQIGAWRAFQEAGIRIGAVAGTSVGALNGALIAMGDLERAEEIWRNIRYSQVIDVDDETMHRLSHGELKGLDLKGALERMKLVLRNGGFDVSPLYSWMKEVVREEAIRASETELYIVTYSLSDGRELELRAKDLAPGAICDMLLASAYLPVFRSEKLGGKRYADGGVRDVLPLHVLIEAGCRDILALRLYGVGLTRRVRIPKGVTVTTLAPREDLGGTLEFDAEQSRQNLTLGYYDAMRLLYGLKGTRYYIDAQLDEMAAYELLMKHIAHYLSGQPVSLRETHERLLPALGKKLGVKKGDYRDLFLACLELTAAQAGLDRFQIYTERDLMEKAALSRWAACPPALIAALKSAR